MVTAVFVAAIVISPIAAVVFRAITAGPALWARAAETQLLPLMVNTGLVALGSSILALSLGALGAILTQRFVFRGQHLALLMLLSPLAVPPYLVAQMWLEVTGPGKPLALLSGLRRTDEVLQASLVIGACLSPACLLILRAALGRLDPRQEEVAASLGYGPLARWRLLLLPSLRPAFASCLAVVAVYACADFGAVSTLGAETFTRAIFFEMEHNLQDREAAFSSSSILALILLALVAAAFTADRWLRRGRSYAQGVSSPQPPSVEKLSRLWQLGTWLLALLITSSTVGVVVVRSIHHATRLQDAGRFWERAGSALLQSGLWAALAASLAVIGACLIAWVATRSRLRWPKLLVPGASLGFVLPGPVIALGLLLAVGTIPLLQNVIYGTASMLIIAYIVRFLPEALQAIDSGLAQIPERLEEASRMLGRTAQQSFLEVTFPLLRSSMLAGWLLVFTASLRELPATLLLKPLGARSLATEIWKYAEDSHYDQMAPAALLLVALSLPSMALLLRTQLPKTTVE